MATATSAAHGSGFSLEKLAPWISPSARLGDGEAPLTRFARAQDFNWLGKTSSHLLSLHTSVGGGSESTSWGNDRFLPIENQ
ncbi:hypothetical protein E2562_007928 [Oryza meyeriana var. granulata]|uniref:Uncharacterized protein n=1 Tax=Oryza meyeriana var. granulata TaxID=110450 RepID=A0A6G1DW06_9ORYZ|nr:hypothetical protein E2562_007928 [Oryza meyeriana var. granulata]